jgi:hypothetical protein
MSGTMVLPVGGADIDALAQALAAELTNGDREQVEGLARGLRHVGCALGAHPAAQLLVRFLAERLACIATPAEPAA